MFKLLAYLHGLLFRFCLKLLAVPFRAIWAVILLVLAWMGEEFRRWTGLAVSGLLVVVTGKAVLNFAPAELKKPLAIAVLVLLLVWVMALRRAVYYTSHNNLRGVRQRQAFRQLSGEVGEVRKRLPGMMARTVQGTPMEGMFRSNREERVREEERQAAAAEQAEAERREAERQAEAERVANVEQERRWRMDLPEDDDLATLSPH